MIQKQPLAIIYLRLDDCQHLLRVVRCLPSTPGLSVLGKTQGQASDKPRGRKPRNHSGELGSATVYGDLNGGSASNPAKKPLCRAMT